MVRTRNTQFPILGLLCIEPMSGYDLRCEIEGTLRFFWRESEGQIYPTLKELERNGHISRVAGEQKGPRDRQLYAITESGHDLLRQWVVQPPQEQPPRNEFLLKVFLMHYGPPGVVLEHIRQQKRQAVARLAALAELQGLVERNAAYPDFPIWMALFRYGVLLRKAEIAWCDETLRAFSRGTPAQVKRTKSERSNTRRTRDKPVSRKTAKRNRKRSVKGQ